eukprot:TRINITY_DN7069_c0_g1_i5.p4 TRINITY_DN7069_c0_g1~~TRINITY_DN7069_c0_g1_i5.p4  ORF type:complete len:127 (-),score=7.64 TRINITY_DN7069_c0_g1_i5:502-882(-)
MHYIYVLFILTFFSPYHYYYFLFFAVVSFFTQRVCGWQKNQENFRIQKKKSNFLAWILSAVLFFVVNVQNNGFYGQLFLTFIAVQYNIGMLAFVCLFFYFLGFQKQNKCRGFVCSVGFNAQIKILN